MNRFIAILLLICFHAQPAMIASVWVDFAVNNDYIKEVLCINKAKPKLNCDGKCYLATKLKQESQQKESKNKTLLAEASNTLVFFTPFKEVTITNPIEILTPKPNFIYSNNYHSLSFSKKDRPPILA